MLDALSKRGNDFLGKKKNNEFRTVSVSSAENVPKNFQIKIVYGFRKMFFTISSVNNVRQEWKQWKHFIESTFLSNFHNFAIIIIYIFATKILQFQNLSEFTVCWMKIYIHANITQRSIYVHWPTNVSLLYIDRNVC